ncbi:hypothetical protein [Streptomyces albireticuli]|uniref:Uncharacterized protein n=1 Tax=Streptomyces albireticuli TaxID=1940 RepID=A0A2A2D672_9ACTN|nr:hypothetical protein [Streptomyces albireticuli]MCD9146036.1 hypothetical protein [Streptomyces albireticuli]MCD9165817.1 hypothetical protein [Streptomyces albireticuli]MCD9196034.1 hypothetical protein [Streptomyces albireticuli]PAU46879.1 hypothetical protein CK936_21475 [Streptomyces albireticuli]
MTDQPPQTPPAEGRASITASVTVVGETAEFLREYAAMTGRTPEEATILWVAGKVVVPPETPLGQDPRVGDWALFDGPEDLAERSHGYLRGDE